MKGTEALLGTALALGICTSAVAAGLPEDRRTLTKSTSFAEMEAFLTALPASGLATVTVEGTSGAGRSLYLVHLQRSPAATWRVLLYAQQHGDEVSGKDALLYLIRDAVRNPETLPADVDLWIMPMVNPDGAEAGTRRNGAGADLNRDHIVLEQPETQALHRVARRLRPHLAVDCHEFSRDSEEWRARGWVKWPDITMDGLNNPLFDPDVVAAAARRVESAAAASARAGHPFLRYWVGGVPPDAEQRHSAPDIDGGLNAIGMYGGLSFIIEAAVRHASGTRDADLGNRVDAYLTLLRHLLADDGRRAQELAIVERRANRTLPAFLPVNYLWANPEQEITRFPVIETATGRTIEVPTANMMTWLVVKRSVSTPAGYAIVPAAAAEIGALLERHGIPFERLSTARPARVEVCTLVRVEDEFDELYGRYEGRQIVTRAVPQDRELPPGALWVPLTGESALRAALVLEPAQLYGLYQYPRFRALVAWDGTLPVLRVLAPPPAADAGSAGKGDR
jgi:hypothetical protein